MMGYFNLTRKVGTNHFLNKIIVKVNTADYFVLLCATVVRDAAGKVGVTGCTPML